MVRPRYPDPAWPDRIYNLRMHNQILYDYALCTGRHPLRAGRHRRDHLCKSAARPDERPGLRPPASGAGRSAQAPTPRSSAVWKRDRSRPEWSSPDAGVQTRRQTNSPGRHATPENHFASLRRADRQHLDAGRMIKVWTTHFQSGGVEKTHCLQAASFLIEKPSEICSQLKSLKPSPFCPQIQSLKKFLTLSTSVFSSPVLGSLLALLPATPGSSST